MADKLPDVKHITMTCPLAGCTAKAFVQVIVFDDKDRQKKVDALARKKLRAQLTEWHKEGAHD